MKCSCLIGAGADLGIVDHLPCKFADFKLCAHLLVPSPIGVARAIEECSLRFETPDNTGNEQRGVLGSALLEEQFVLRCLGARAITEAA